MTKTNKSIADGEPSSPCLDFKVDRVVLFTVKELLLDSPTAMFVFSSGFDYEHILLSSVNCYLLFIGARAKELQINRPEKLILDDVT